MVSELNFEEIGLVKIYKKKGLKRLSLSIRNGQIRVNTPYIIPKKIIIGINNYNETIEWPQKKADNKTINWNKVSLNKHDCFIGVSIILKNGKVIDAGDYQDLTGRPQFYSVEIHLLPDSTIVFKNIFYSK